MTQITEVNLRALIVAESVRFRLLEDDDWMVGEVGHEVRGYYARDDKHGVRFWADEIAEIEAI